MQLQPTFKKITFLIFVINSGIFIYFVYENPRKLITYVEKLDVSDVEVVEFKLYENFINEVSPKRLNTLFDILYEKETVFSIQLRNLEILMFEDLINNNNDFVSNKFDKEINEYLQVVDKRVRSTNKFANYLNNMSYFYSFGNFSKDAVVKKNLTQKVI